MAAKSLREKSKIGFFAALTVLLGSVVGIGIFFKNASVGRGVEQEGLAWILAWIIGGVIVLFTAISYAEIGRLGSSKISGLGFWASLVGGKRFGHFVAVGFAILYLAIDTAAISVFVSEIFFNMLGTTFEGYSPSVVMTIHIAMGVLFTAAILITKRISIKGSGYIQIVTTVIKFLPLIATALIGLWIASFGTATTSTDVATATKIVLTPGSRIVKIFFVLPAVLFAYDSFLNVASMTGRVKNGERRMPLILFMGLSIVIVLYTLIGLASALTETSTVSQMFSRLTTDENVAFYIGKFIDVMLFISAFGVLNGIAMVFDTATTNLCDEEIFVGSRKAKKKFGKKHASLLYVVVLFAFFVLFFAAVSIPFGTDVFVDGISNYTTLVFFIIYGSVIALYTFKRHRFELTRINSPLFYVSSILAIVSIVVLEGFYVVSLILDIVNSSVSTISWGAFAGYDYKFRSFLPLLLFFLYIVALLVLHYGNIYLAKRGGRDVLAIIESQKPHDEESEEEDVESVAKK